MHIDEELLEKSFASFKKVSEQNKNIVRDVLIHNKKQAEVVAKYKVSRSLVSQIIKRHQKRYEEFTSSPEDIVPTGWRKVELILPARQATLIEALGKELISKPNIGDEADQK